MAGWKGGLALASEYSPVVPEIFAPGWSAMFSAAWKVLMGTTLLTVVSLNRVEQGVDEGPEVLTQAERMLPSVLNSCVGNTMEDVLVLALTLLKEMRLLAGPKALFRPVRLLDLVPMPVALAVTEANGARA